MFRSKDKTIVCKSIFQFSQMNNFEPIYDVYPDEMKYGSYFEN